MKPQLRQQFVKDLEETFLSLVRITAGEHATEEGMKVVASDGLNAFRNMPFYRTLIESLEKEPDSRFQILHDRVTKEMVPWLRRELAKGIKRLPHARGGRPSSLSEKQKRAVCESVLELIRQGASEHDALSQVSQSLGAHVRTIQRAWNNRGTLLVTQQPVDDRANVPKRRGKRGKIRKTGTRSVR